MWRVLIILICAFNKSSGNPIEELSYENRENLKNHVRTAEIYYENKRARIEKRSVDDEDTGGSLIKTLSAQFTGGNLEPNAICPACGFLVDMMQGFVREGQTDENIIDVAVYFCDMYAKMPHDICQGLLQNNMPPLLYIFRTQNFTSSAICAFVVDERCRQPDDPIDDWEVDIPPPQDCELERTEPDVPECVPKLKVLHLSDIHLDLRYVINASAECSFPLCCRENSGEPKPNRTLGGPCGGWRCDTPISTLVNLFQHVKENHPDIDYIIWTGDTAAHDSWSISKAESLLALDETISLFVEYFPDTPVVHAVGNHEAVPMNMFPSSDVPDEYKINWLYDALSERLRKWLPEDTIPTIRSGGYYTFLIRPGFRIISLNTNLCYTNNWWLALNSTDPQLQWLVDILQEAETNREMVHIIGHVPPGYEDCIEVWKRNYYKIVNRFAAIITGQFFGHTHKDEIGMYYNENGKATGVAYIGCSVSPYTFLNPCYTILYIDGDRENSTRRVIDRECHYFQLEECNEIGSPTWTKLYSARKAYNMKSLKPEEWNTFYERLTTDDELCDLYQKHRWRDSPKRPPFNREKLLCGIKSCPMYGMPETRSGDNTEDNINPTTNVPDTTTITDNSDGTNGTEPSDVPSRTDSSNDIDSTETNTSGYSGDTNTTNNPDDPNSTDSTDSTGSTESQTT